MSSIRSLPRSKRGSQQHVSYANNGHLLSRGHVYSVACHGVVRVLVHACVVRASVVDRVKMVDFLNDSAIVTGSESLSWDTAWVRDFRSCSRERVVQS